MAGDSWLQSYEACTRKGQDIMEKISKRNRLQKNSQQHSKESAHIRTALRDFTSKVNNLRDELMRDATRHHITQREAERRETLLDQLTTQEKKLDQAFKLETGGARDQFTSSRYSDGAARSSLLGGSSNDPWGVREESEDTAHLAVSDIRQQQATAIREQDAGLESLSNVLGRQKQMALDIGNEVDVQNDLIEDITDHVDRTDQRLLRETRHIKIIDRKSNTCWMWVLIVFLFIGIIVIAVVPYKGKP